MIIYGGKTGKNTATVIQNWFNWRTICKICKCCGTQSAESTFVRQLSHTLMAPFLGILPGVSSPFLSLSLSAHSDTPPSLIIPWSHVTPPSSSCLCTEHFCRRPEVLSGTDPRRSQKWLCTWKLPV
jgi:hypothetical protein